MQRNAMILQHKALYFLCSYSLHILVQAKTKSKQQKTRGLLTFIFENISVKHQKPNTFGIRAKNLVSYMCVVSFFYLS